MEAVTPQGNMTEIQLLLQRCEKWLAVAPSEFERVFAQHRIDVILPVIKFASKDKKDNWQQAQKSWTRLHQRWVAQQKIWKPRAKFGLDPEGHALEAAIAIKVLWELEPFLGFSPYHSLVKL